MQSEIMLICDTDERYAALLAEYINSREHASFLAEPFSEEASARKYAVERQVQIVLLGGGLSADQDVLDRWKKLCSDRGSLLICLTEQADHPAGDTPALRKYQAADQLLRSVLELYAMHRPGAGAPDKREAAAEKGDRSCREGIPFAAAQKDSPSEGELREKGAGWNTGVPILGVYSPIGRCGKTSFAIVLGEMLAFREHVLYVNLEEYSGFTQLNGDRGEGDLSDLIYFSRIPGGQLIYKLESMVQTWERLDYIVPASYADDLREISADEWRAFLSRLSSEGDYDHIVLDIGNGREDVCSLLAMCERVYVPVLDDPASDAKLQQFMENMGHMPNALPEEKIVYLHLPEPGKLENNTQIPFPQRLVRGKMGAYVKKLIAGEQMSR